MKNTGERVMAFVKGERRGVLVGLIVCYFAALAIPAWFYVYEIADENTVGTFKWWDILRYLLAEVAAVWGILFYRKQYNIALAESANPSLIAKSLKLTGFRYFPGDSDTSESFNYEFEGGVYITQGQKINNLIIGETYRLRLLEKSGNVFDIKTLQGELIDDQVVTKKNIFKVK